LYLLTKIPPFQNTTFMQKLGLSQQLGQKLSPQQIQFIKLLQIPTMELESRIEEELEVNPALDEGKDENIEETQLEEHTEEASDDINIDELLRHDDWGGYKMQGDGADPNKEENDIPIVGATTMSDLLVTQVGFMRLDDRKKDLALQLVGSIDSDGYLRRELDSIVDDLIFTQNVETDTDELQEILTKIQAFDPPGVGAQNLQECLLLQLERIEESDPETRLAYKIVHDHFEQFTKKHYKKIILALGIEEDELKIAIDIITKLNPKPGGASSASTAIGAQYIIPDFILEIEDDNTITVSLNSRNAPELRVSSSFVDILDTYSKSTKQDKKLKETVSFVKQKLDAAKWFIESIKQRQQTLLKTMRTIVDIQQDYFLEGDESCLRPMILKDIAEKIGMDISTISRVVNSKSVQTDFGTFLLKSFFSESIMTDSGVEVSSREVKNELKKIIDAEHKTKPLSDDKIVKILNDAGYNLARRTVAKYREQLSIPVARLRKEL
jgi:RNA polymerase sigma-54 factor